MLKSFVFPLIAALCAHVMLFAGSVPLGNLIGLSLGALALTSMAGALILAARWRWVDWLLGGPDKAYMLHRTLGIMAIVGTLGHWVTASSFGAGAVPFLADSGEGAGTLAAIALLIMTAAAMIRAIPYHLWKASHWLMGPAFLAGVYHTLLVPSPVAVGSLPWVFLVAVCVLGVFGWAATMWRRSKRGDRVTVSRVTRFAGAVDITLRSDTALAPFRAGQFAQLRHDTPGSEAHPFTIAGGSTHSRRFIIRAGGDWTRDIARTIKSGDTLRVGAGEGRFLPQISPRRRAQLWIAGGVGVTPFLVALEQMTSDDGARVTLVYCIRNKATAAGLTDLQAHAARLKQLDLVVLDGSRGARLTPVRARELMAGLAPKTDLYLCGPEGLKTVAQLAWAESGCTGVIRHERFDFRSAMDLPTIGTIKRGLVWLWAMAQRRVTT